MMRFVVFLAATLFAFSLPAADEMAELLIARGDAEEQQGKPKAALILFQQAEKLEPNHVPLLLRLARLHSDLVNETEKKEDAQKSLEYARRALALDPKSAKAHLSVAVAYGKMTDFVGNKTKMEYSRILKEETEKSLELDPTDSFAWYLLGRWHFGVANVNGILKLLAKVVYGGMPKATNEEAARCLRKAAELSPKVVVHRSALARVYTALGQHEEAKKEWRIVLTLKAEDAEEEADQKEAEKVLAKERP